MLDTLLFIFSRRKADSRTVYFARAIAAEDFSKGIITGWRQCPAETLSEACGLGIIEPAKDAMANQATRAQQCRINVGGGTIDRADDLQAEKIRKHSIGQIQDGADLFAIVRTTSHQRRVRILQYDDKSFIGMMPSLIGPEADEIGP